MELVEYWGLGFTTVPRIKGNIVVRVLADYLRISLPLIVLDNCLDLTHQTGPPYNRQFMIT